MSALLKRAELDKLAALLEVPEAELEFLGALDVPALRQLRQVLSAALFDRQAPHFKRLADSSHLLPKRLVAFLSEHVIGARLSAQTTGLLPPEDAVKLSARLSIPFQADICRLIDPRRAAPMLQLMPVDTVVAVALELQARGEYITMARFVDELTDAQIQAVADRMSGDGLLKSGVMVESDARLNQLLGLFSDAHLRQTAEVAFDEEGELVPEAELMLERLDATQRGRLERLLDAE